MFCAVWCQIRKLSTRKSVNARAKTKPRGEARRERVGAKKGETKTQGANGNQRGSKIPPTTPWVVQKGQYSWSTTLPNLVVFHPIAALCCCHSTIQPNFCKLRVRTHQVTHRVCTRSFLGLPPSHRPTDFVQTTTQGNEWQQYGLPFTCGRLVFAEPNFNQGQV